MARLTGANLKAFFVDATGTIEITGIRSLEDGISQQSADTTAAGDTITNNAKTQLAVAPKVTYVQHAFNTTWPGVYGTVTGVPGSALHQRLKPGSDGTLLWAPNGTASSVGNPKYGISCFVGEHSAGVQFDAAFERTISFMPNTGSWVHDGGTAVW